MPTALHLEGARWRLYFTGRTELNKSQISFVDAVFGPDGVQVGEPAEPVMALGPLGSFDVDGIMPSSVLRVGDEVWLYYIGWTQRKDVPYHNAVGLAVSRDGGVTFHRMRHGPIVGTGPKEPFFCGTSCVVQEGDLWRMWYMSCTEWREWNGHPEPRYHLRYATSANGVDWKIEDRTSIDYEDDEEGGVARATVLKKPDGYHMWFCRRSWRDYRTSTTKGYRIGYAVSRDGVSWERRDDDFRFVNPPMEGDWDGRMQAYPFVLELAGQTVLLYNGDDFGRHGLGYATLVAGG